MKIPNKIWQKGFEFERLVLGLLKAEAESLSNTLLSGVEAGAHYRLVDAIAPEGFFDLPGPCLIEIKLKLRIDILQRTIDRLNRGDINWSSLLIIADESPSKIKKVESSLNKHYPNHQFKILGREHVNSLKNKHPNTAVVFDENLSDQAIDSLSSREAKNTSSQYITSLKSAYQQDQLVLFLGAGVSLASGMPSWNELLTRLTNALVREHLSLDDEKNNEKEIVEYFKTGIPDSPLIIARILRDRMGNKFADHVGKALYESNCFVTNADLVEKIGALCTPGRIGQGLIAVINYNFDELIESELERRGISYLSIISEDEVPSQNELPIYHPHGFLPCKGVLAQKHRDGLVLSEDSYHSQFSDPYSWANITQLNLLRNNVCLFVGLSMTDPNLRRLLEISQKKCPGQRHYAILKDHWVPSNKAMKNITLKLANVFRGLEEGSFSKLGITVVWIEDYNEIPDILRDIRA